MPAASVFIDTNVFLYSIDETEFAKKPLAQTWLLHLSELGIGAANLQVLNEVTNLLLKRRNDVDVAEVFRIVDRFALFGDQPLSKNDTALARKLRARFAYSWWDCVLLAAASNLGCTHFLSEDLQDGQTIEGLTIVSPFAHTPDQILHSR